MYACMYVMYITYAWMYVYTYVYIYIHTYVHAYIHTKVKTHAHNLHTHTHISTKIDSQAGSCILQQTKLVMLPMMILFENQRSSNAPYDDTL